MAVCAFVGMIGNAFAASTWNLSLPADSAERTGLESHRSLFERTLAIELKDEQIVGRVGEAEGSASLYVRVSYQGQNLRIAVWDRGDAAGERIIAGSGGPALVARRVALTTVELVRKLSVRRSAERRRALEEEARERAAEAEALAQRKRERPRLSAGLLGVGFPSAGLLIGPELGLRLNGDDPLRFGVSLSYGAGFLTALPSSADSGPPSFSLWSVELSSSYVLSTPARTEFSLGPYVRASSFQGSWSAQGDPSMGRVNALTAQAGLFAQVEPRPSEALGLFFRADAGIVLAPVPLEAGDPATELGGLGIGLALGATLGL